jgi:hypothetical protein
MTKTNSNTALTPLPTAELDIVPALNMQMRRRPTEVLAEAKEAADALMSVIEAKANKVTFNGETYLEYEDWLTVASFYDTTVQIEWTREVVRTKPDSSIVTGYEARAAAVSLRDGRILSTAEAECLDDEDNWGVRSKQKWLYVLRSGGTAEGDPGKDEIIWEDNPNKLGKKRPKKLSMNVDAPVPAFQRRSMAQTRAGAKALRNLFARIVVLAGYRPTPAEELPVERTPNVPEPTAPLAQAAKISGLAEDEFQIRGVTKTQTVTTKAGPVNVFAVQLGSGDVVYTKSTDIADAADQHAKDKTVVQIRCESKGGRLWIVEYQPQVTIL